MAGTIYVRNEITGQLVSEIKKSGANKIPLALESGTYKVTMIQENQTLESSVKLKAGRSVSLSSKYHIHCLPYPCHCNRHNISLPLISEKAVPKAKRPRVLPFCAQRTAKKLPRCRNEAKKGQPVRTAP